MTNTEAIEYLKRADVTVGQEVKTTMAEALEMGIEALKTLDEIIEYMNDKTVTWRDISDDIINSILSEHNWKE